MNLGGGEPAPADQRMASGTMVMVAVTQGSLQPKHRETFVG